MTRALTAAVFHTKRGPRQIMCIAPGSDGDPDEVVAVLSLQSDLTKIGEERFLEAVAAAIAGANLALKR